MLCVYAFGGLQGIDHTLRDTQFRLFLHKVETDLVLIDIDPKSLRELERWPWPRIYHAELLQRLSAAKPSAVVFDIDFSSRSNPLDDSALAQSLKHWSNSPVILVAFMQFNDASRQQIIANYPIQMLREHARIASINLFPASDGLVRGISTREQHHPPQAPILAHLLQSTDRLLPEQVYIDYSIHPASFPRYSYADILAGRFQPAAFKDKKIIVGATAIELRDQISVPLHRVLPGPLVQAMLYESIRDRALESAPVWMSILVSAFLAAILMLYLHRKDRQMRLWQVVAIWVGVYLVALIMYQAFDVLIDSSPYLVSVAMIYLVKLIAGLDKAALVSLAQSLQLQRKQNHIQSIRSTIQEGLISTDDEGVIVAVNPACSSIFACRASAMLGRSVASFFPSIRVSGGCVLIDAEACVNGQRKEVTACRLNGDAVITEVTISQVEGEDQAAITFFVRDMSALQQKQALLDFHIQHDPVTRQLNRLGFMQSIERDIQKTPIHSSRALLLIEIKSVVDVNNELGHAAGDAFVRVISDRLTAIQHTGVLATARIAQAQFGLWLAGEKQQALVYASQIAQQLEQPVQVGAVQVSSEFRMGLAMYPEQAQSASDLLRYASIALCSTDQLQHAVKLYNDEQHVLTALKLTLASQLREAISTDALSLCYQPQLCIAQGRIKSVEALLRWNHPTLGYVPPDEFIALAEESGIIKPLTAWVIQAVTLQRQRWAEQGIDLQVAVNISSKLLADHALLELLEQIPALSATDNPASTKGLILEITESAVMDHWETALSLLQQLSQAGYRLSLDDFGTGHSSFAYLKNLPVNELKIDKSFVLDMVHNAKDRQIVFSIIDLAHRLGLEVVAEGVESDKILAMLAWRGCEYAQGYGIARPLAADAIVAMIEQYKTAAV